MTDMTVQLFQYSLAASLTLVVLWAVYRFVLSSQRRPYVNRVAIISIYLLSIAVFPLLSALSVPPSGAAPAVDAGWHVPATVMRAASAVWCAGVAVCAGLGFAGMARMLAVCRRCRVARIGGRKVRVSDSDALSPFSFGGLIVMNESDFGDNPDMILLHEEGHARGLHVLDLCLAQVVAVMLWYNPAAWLMRSELVAVHEFLADRHVLRSGCDARRYQMFLVGKAAGAGRRAHLGFPSAVNGFDCSEIRRRVSMMNTPVEHGALSMLRYAALPAGVYAAVMMLSLWPVRTALAEPADSAAEAATVGGMGIYIDGQSVTLDELNALPSSSISAITVNRRDGRLEIETE